MKKLTENLIQQRLKTCTTDLDKVQQINVTGRELKDVSLLRKMTGVEILSLSVNQISTLVDFQGCKNLRELYLRQNKIANINEIVYLKQLPKLELLMLSQNPCADNPLYRMTVIKNLKNLTELDGTPITPEERRQAQKVGEEVVSSSHSMDPVDNAFCIPDGPQIHRTPTQSIQKLKESDESLVDTTPPNAPDVTEQTKMEKHSRKKINEESVKATPLSQKKNKTEKVNTQQMFETKKDVVPPSEYNPMAVSLCKLCGNGGTSLQNTIIPKNANILSATLSLLKELDYSSLQVINAEVCSRLNAFEVNFICNRQPFISRNGGIKEIMQI